MNRVIIRQAINLKILMLIGLALSLMLFMGFIFVYVKDFNDKTTQLRETLELGDWEQVEIEFSELKQRQFFNKRILMLELDYLHVKTLEKANPSDLMRMLQLANYLYRHYDVETGKVEEILAETYYELGNAYYQQADYYLQKVHQRYLANLVVESNKDKFVNLYKKLYRVSEYLKNTEESISFLEKIISLEEKNYSFHVKLGTGYLQQKKYDKVVETLEHVLFSNEKYMVSLQKSAMMLYALSLHLNLTVKADFYLEYIVAKSYLFQTSQQKLREEFYTLMKTYKASDTINFIFEEIDRMTLENGLAVST